MNKEGVRRALTHATAIMGSRDKPGYDVLGSHKRLFVALRMQNARRNRCGLRRTLHDRAAPAELRGRPKLGPAAPLAG